MSAALENVRFVSPSVADAVLQGGEMQGRMYVPADAREAGLRVVSGAMVPALLGEYVPALAQVIHAKFGEGKAQGFMHQPPVGKIEKDMMDGGYAVTVLHVSPDANPLFVATAHVRNAKSGEPNKRELGGVVATKGHGRRIVAEGVWLARQQGADHIEALVAVKNIEGQTFFPKVGTPVGERPSNLVTDPETGLPAQMVIYDVSNAHTLH